MSADIERYETRCSPWLPIGCLLVEDGVIRKANPEAIETMGIPGDRLVGVPLTELLVPEYERACLELLDQARTGNESDHQERAGPAGPRPGTDGAAGPGTDADDVVMVGVRSMANEHYYSAQAGGALTHDTVTGFPDHYHVLSQLHERLLAPPTASRWPSCACGSTSWPRIAEDPGQADGATASCGRPEPAASRTGSGARTSWAASTTPASWWS